MAFIGKPIVEDGNNRFLWKIRDELEEALEELDLDNIYTEEEDLSDTDVAKKYDFIWTSPEQENIQYGYLCSCHY